MLAKGILPTTIQIIMQFMFENERAGKILGKLF
jgi:hypothetical protein